MNTEFDFGFTAVTEEELDVVQNAASIINESQDSLDLLQEKVDNIYNLVQPLLNNLKMNPEKDYIHWPDRLEKVEQFSDLIDEVYKR